ADGDRADPFRFRDRAENIRRAPAGRESDEHIVRGEAAVEEIAYADGRVVLGGLGGTAEGGFTSGDDALHHLGRDAESGRTLGGIEHSKTAAGPGAYVKESSP